MPGRFERKMFWLVESENCKAIFLLYLTFEFDFLLTYDTISLLLRAAHVTLGKISVQMKYVKLVYDAESRFVRYDFIWKHNLENGEDVVLTCIYLL